MFKNYFKGIDGIADYPLISLVIFFLFFCAMMIWCFRADKKRLKEQSRLPLNTNPDPDQPDLNH